MTRTRLRLLAAVVGLGLLAQFGYLVPDSSGYVSWGRSLLWDGDIDFTNEYAAFGMLEADVDAGIDFGARTATGRPGNPFGMGTALLWMPWLLLSLLVTQVFAGAGQLPGADGFNTATLFAAHLGSWTLVLLAWAWVQRSVHCLRPAASAPRWAVAAAFLASPLPYYVWQFPSYSHAASTASVALVVLLSLLWRDAPTLRRAMCLGLLIGVAALVRIQNLAFLWFPLCVWWPAWRRHGGTGPGIAALIAASVVGVLPQLVAWRLLYGAWLQIPQGSGFVHLGFESLSNVLLSTRHGLWTATPVFLLGAVLVIWRGRRWGTPLWVGLIGCAAFQWVANAAPVDWWAGWSFGARRFCNLVPLVALALALLHGRAARIALATLLTCNVVQWLRIATRHLSGEGDPGWNGLWGSGFLEFLPKVPEAVWTLMSTPWDRIAVLAQPGAGGLQVVPAPGAALWTLYGVWALAVVLLGPRLGRLPRATSDSSGNSPGAPRV